MHADQWQLFVEQCSQLSQRQRLAGISLLQDGAAQDAAIALRIISPESLLKATMGSFPHMMVT